MSGSEPNDIEFRMPRTFIVAQSVRVLPNDDGGHSLFFSPSSSRVASTYPASAAPKHGNPALTGCRVIASGRPDRDPRRHLQAVRRAVHDEGVVRDGDRPVREVDPAATHRVDVAPAYDVLDGAQLLELPHPEGGRLGHGRRDRAVDAQHDAGVLQPQEQVVQGRRRPRPPRIMSATMPR